MRIYAAGLIVGLAIAGTTWPMGCAAPKASGEEVQKLEDEVAEAKKEFIEKDSGMQRWFNDSYGFAMYPTVGKGAAVVGGAHGDGLVYEQGKAIGTSALSQATIGLQLGGQAYREVVFFEDKAALDKFTQGDFSFSAQASAVAVTAGASADADFHDGMAIFTIQKGGLMFEASVGGQRFSFRKLD